MRSLESWVLCAVLIGTLSVSAGAQAKETVLYAFGANGGTSDGVDPNGAVVFDSAGNLYGTTLYGGNASSACPLGCGTIFELSPVQGGGWTETVIHSFSDDQDGAYPSSGLIMDAAGNLYGTTEGDDDIVCQAPNCGTVFKLTPGLDGSWAETMLYSFAGAPDGVSPHAPLVLDSLGNLYGNTLDGGINDYGTAFEVSPPSQQGGNWTESVLYSFCQLGGPKKCLDGAYPSGTMVLDGSGNLYGTTGAGGSKQVWGLVYELSPGANGTWSEKVLYPFDGTHGGLPQSGVSTDTKGNLYGTMYSGGLSGPNCPKELYPPYSVACGGVFRLTPGAKGSWTEDSFLFTGNNGGTPIAGVVIASGAAYGTTTQGGGGYGTVFRVTSGGVGTAIYKFCPKRDCTSGEQPVAGVTVNNGKLYGVAVAGGIYNQGVVFSIEP